MSDAVKVVFRRYGNKIADKLNKKLLERRGINGNKLHVLYLVLGEEHTGRLPTTVPIVISKETIAQVFFFA